MSQSGWVHLEDCNVLRVTEKAAYIEWGDERYWFPLSQISDADNLDESDEGVTVSITEWIAEQKGIDPD
jgi:hypothetical protein